MADLLIAGSITGEAVFEPMQPFVRESESFCLQLSQAAQLHL